MNHDMETLTFAGVDYPVRHLYLPSSGNVLISTTILNNALMGLDGTYSAEEAKIVDERIFYFITLNDMELDDNQLIQLLSYELDVEEGQL